jgi:anthranilate/para-aminobenzoate synthase component II
VFAGLPSPLEVGRYHSLVADPTQMPRDLIVTATTTEGEIMGLRHATLAVEGVQFHPESVLTPEGPALLRNFLATSGGAAAATTLATPEGLAARAAGAAGAAR